ncbi:hypothetical protein F4X88_21655 [Candidatus Poribacteria bacterium]|nr:hypothetical protein [Candidatus Poribacteria bacterium]MYA58891.1 hypothetical protein [Candidatus Poribacteria bacterium]
MFLPKTRHILCACILILAVLFGNVPTLYADSSVSFFNSDFIIAMGVGTVGYYLTPLDDWQAKIHKLEQDELFVQRWMLLNDEPASLEKGKRALENIRKERETIKKKRNRFRLWYYPTITIVGTGVLMLAGWIFGGSS